MRKRWIFVAVASALVLAVLTAGLAFASSRWDGEHRSQQAVTNQVATRSTQQAAGSCDGTAVRERTRTQQATQDRHRAGWADDHTTGGVSGAQATPPAAATNAPSTGQQARDRDHQQDRDHQAGAPGPGRSRSSVPGGAGRDGDTGGEPSGRLGR